MEMLHLGLLGWLKATLVSIGTAAKTSSGGNSRAPALCMLLSWAHGHLPPPPPPDDTVLTSSNLHKCKHCSLL